MSYPMIVRILIPTGVGFYVEIGDGSFTQEMAIRAARDLLDTDEVLWGSWGSYRPGHLSPEAFTAASVISIGVPS